MRLDEVRLAKLDGEYYMHGYPFRIEFSGKWWLDPSTHVEDDRRIVELVDRKLVRYFAYRKFDGIHYIILENMI